MRNSCNTYAAVHTGLNTKPVSLLSPAAPGFCMPPCVFAGATCSDCDHYYGKFCYYHRQPVDPDKWPCSYFK